MSFDNKQAYKRKQSYDRSIAYVIDKLTVWQDGNVTCIKLPPPLPFLAQENDMDIL